MLNAFQLIKTVAPNSLPTRGGLGRGHLESIHFAGTGPLLPSLQRTVVEMGLEHHVTFAGVLSKEQVRELICRSDAAILLKTIDDWTIYE